MIIESKYNIGQTVYSADYKSIQVPETCGLCLGEKTWTVKSPSGEEFQMECPACYYAYNSTGRKWHTEITPTTKALTIGQVNYDRNYEGGGSEFRYMCEETGIGSGTVHRECHLSLDESTALVLGELKAVEARKSIAEQEKRQHDSRMKDAYRRIKSKPCPYCTGTGKRKDIA